MKNATKPQSKPQLPKNFSDTFLQENGIELESDYIGFGLVPANNAAKNVVNGMKQQQKSAACSVGNKPQHERRIK